MSWERPCVEDAKPTITLVTIKLMITPISKAIMMPTIMPIGKLIIKPIVSRHNARAPLDDVNGVKGK